MAAVTSGRIETGTYTLQAGVTAKGFISWTRDSVSVAGNSSTLTFKTGVTLAGGAWFGTNAVKIVTATAGSTNLGTGTYSSISGNGDTVLSSKTVTLTHDSTGSLTFSLGLTMWFIDGGNFTGSGTFTLPQIARASSIASVTAAVPLDGSTAATVTITRQDASFTHKVEWLAPDGTVMVTQTGIATSASFTPVAATWLAKTPNGTSMTPSVRVTTLSGSTMIGSAVSSTFTMTVPASVVPSVGTPTATRIATGLPAGVTQYVQGKTGVTVAFNAGVAGSGATISGWALSGPNGSASGTGGSGSVTVSTLTTVGTQTYTVTLTDSRGRTATGSVSLSVTAYNPPTLSGLSAFRSNSAGTSDPSAGTYIRALATSTTSTVTGLTVTRTVSWRPSTTTTPSGSVAFTSGTAVVVGAGAITSTAAWVVTWTVTDNLGGTATATMPVPSVQRHVNLWGTNGVAHGGMAVNDNETDIIHKLHVRSTQQWDQVLTPQNGIDQTLNGVSVLPNVFSWQQAQGLVVGTLAIRLPVGLTSTMMNITIDGYSYSSGAAWQLIVGAYNYAASGGSLANGPSMVVLGNPPTTSFRIAYDGTNVYILIGTTATSWAYPVINVSIRLMFSNYTHPDWRDRSKWGASVMGSEPAWTLVTVLPQAYGTVDGTLPVLGSIAAGWTMTVGGCWRRNGMCALSLTAIPAATIAVSQPNTVLCVLPTGYRPVWGAAAHAGLYNAPISIDSGGNVYLRSVGFAWGANASHTIQFQYMLVP